MRNIKKNKRKKSVLTIAISCLILTGCAKSTADLSTTYVSPMQYQGYSCEQVSMELARVAARVGELGGKINDSASNDAAITAVGIILFWPILFALGGTKQQEAEYSRLRGEYDALNQIAIQKKCGQSSNSTSSQQQQTPQSQSNNIRQGQRITVNPQPTNSTTNLSLDDAVEKCKALGIIPDTEKFGTCVLTLSK